MHLLDVLVLIFLKLSEAEGLLLEILFLSLQVLDLSVFLQLKSLAVDLVLEVAQLSHDHAHVAAVGIEEVFLLVRAYFLNKFVDGADLLVDQVHAQHHFLSRVQIRRSLL